MLLQLQLISLIFSCFFVFAAAIDTIGANESLRDSEALTSDGKRFKLSFFSPPNSSYHYVGIMFNLPVMTVVWVANRDRPLNDSSSTLQISSDGNLVIFDGRKEIVWSTNVSTSAANTSAVLLDTGNLVLQDNFNNNSSIIWESFLHASDSYLEKMRLFTDLSSNQSNFLTSWRSPDDPTRGRFTSTIEPNIPELFVRKDGNPCWRSGPWNGQTFIGMPQIKYVFSYGTEVGSDSPGNAYEVFATNPNGSSVLKYYVLNSSGSVEEKVWSDAKRGWDVTWSSTSNECDAYGKCGPFGICNSQETPICTCLRGFVPRRKDEWEARNWTSGCTREALLQCEKNSSVDNKQDEFLKVRSVKLPHYYILLSSFDGGDCEATCLSSCSCIAYADPSGIGCMHWTDNLTDTQKFSSDGEDLYIRLPYSELDKKQDRRGIIVTTVVLGFILIAGCTYFLPKLLLKCRCN